MQTLKLILLLSFSRDRPSCPFVLRWKVWWQLCFLASHNLFGYNILDKTTKQNVMLIGQTNYIYDTVKVYHENWDVAYPGPVRGDGFFALQFIDPVIDKGVVNNLSQEDSLCISITRTLTPLTLHLK